VPNVEAPRRSQRVRKSAIPADYEVYNTEEFQMEDDPTSFEEAIGVSEPGVPQPTSEFVLRAPNPGW